MRMTMGAALALACLFAACGNNESTGGGGGTGAASGGHGGYGAGTVGGGGAAGGGATGGGGSAPVPWAPPIGIPEPPFGINEQAPPRPADWGAEVPGFYYVETAGCDDGRTYGHPGAPRCTIPASVPAGALVALNGQLDSNQSFAAAGTVASPVFVVAYDAYSRPLLTVSQAVSGSYVVLEMLGYGPADANDSEFGFWTGEGSDHIVLRHSELSGNLQRAGGVGIGSWSYAGAESASFDVVFDVTVHDLGTLDANWDQDAHCVTVNGSVDNLWVLDSKLSRCSGDGIQIEAQTGRRDKIHHVYYGRNLSHDNRQSGGWVKHATDVVFSQNLAFGFRNNSGGPGPCFGQQYGPERVWYLYNEGHDCNIGIIVGSGDPPGDGADVYMIGNLIHDTQTENVGDPYNSGCIESRGPSTLWVVNNTCANVEGGVLVPPGTPAANLWNNIVRREPTTAAQTYDLYTEGGVTLVVEHNIFSASPRFTDGTEQTTCAGLSAMATASNCSTADPQFLSATDFHVAFGSPAIDTGMEASVYATFQGLYGLDIAFDRDEVARPQGTAWDLGAYEYEP